MAYELVIGAELWHQIMTLPVDARAVVGGAMRAVELVPWNGTPVPVTNAEAPLRRLDFGPPGAGFVHYLMCAGDDVDAALAAVSGVGVQVAAGRRDIRHRSGHAGR